MTKIIILAKGEALVRGIEAGLCHASRRNI